MGLMALITVPSVALKAQHEFAAPGHSTEIGTTSMDIAPGVVPHTATTQPTPEALWDIQFAYNSTDTINRAGMAAANFVNGEFWVSRWASDTLVRFDQDGTVNSIFTIPGLTGVRCFAYDGTYLYAGTNTTTIYRIDPGTATLAPPHITVAGAVGAVRHCTYSPALNSGAGGFYVGNFNTDIFAISMTGATLSGSTIPAATHAQTGMYGSAYDDQTAGGPYLWIFAQSGANTSQINRLQLPAGTPTTITHDVMSDVGPLRGLTSGLAGGLFISDQVISGQWTLGGLIQGTPDNILFGYELSDPLIFSADAKMDALRPTEGYTQIPLTQVFGETFDATFSNFGSNTLDSVYVDYVVRFGGSTVFTNSQVMTNLAPGASSNLISAPFTPVNGVGTYDVWAITRLGGTQIDSLPTNDSLLFTFQVTDSTYARDNNVHDGSAGYAVSSTDWAYATSNFTLYAPDTVTSIWISVATPVTGDTTYAAVAATLGGGFPNNILTLGPVYLINANTNDYVLEIPGGLPLAAGTYAFGCYEGTTATIDLKQSSSVYTSDVNYFYTPTSAWVSSGIQTARFIRPNFGTPTAVGKEDALASRFADIYPNPNSGNFMIAFREGFEASAQISVVNAVGQVVYTQSVEPANQKMVNITLENQAAGMYFVRIDNGTESLVKKMVIRN